MKKLFYFALFMASSFFVAWYDFRGTLSLILMICVFAGLAGLLRKRNQKGVLYWMLIGLMFLGILTLIVMAVVCAFFILNLWLGVVFFVLVLIGFCYMIVEELIPKSKKQK